ncbi:uncharacterized protein TOT_020000195 [Theileria orientalis strain Shintoku]|uniref:Uncharacterized protein n=1 Tax=Theileria orientalis strain Shintoku TaxID=869250 RepID=J4DP16_THEOR|nr:uncharacterized protein TOT_020000195 [Theileria orientalis strain Shintoku]BAM39924.1 uncharacterized protein TOT_020000195 [Theileria orientalis strain Shintoku]|eukprot:XP_009690225.1 uncharacterized protein TOT_020000195 [Theileria orientalis strain Shintoku]
MILYVYIFILLIKYSPLTTFVHANPPNVLNIAGNVDDSISMHFHEKLPGFSVTTYLASRIDNITKIIDGAYAIWEATIPGTRLSLFKMYRRQGINKLAYIYSVGNTFFYTRYYEKVPNGYRKITQALFQYKLEKLIRERCIDLSEEIDTDIFMVQSHDLYGLMAYVIIPYDKYDVISVSYGFDILWEQKFGSGKCTSIIFHGQQDDLRLVHLNIKQTHTQGEIFLANCNGDFIPVTKEYFYHVLNNMDSEEKQKLKRTKTANDYQTLNISDYSKDACYSVLKERYKGLVLSTFVALRCQNIKKLMDSAYTIWDGTRSGKHLYVFKVYSLNNKYQIGYLYLHSDITSRTRYYQKRGYNWFEISLAEFGLLLGRLEVERPIDLNDSFDTSVFLTQKHNFFGLPATVVIPRERFVITNITDDDELIWRRPSTSHKCTSVIIHGHRNNPRMLHLHIKDENSHKELFFFKHDGWSSTKKPYFYFRLSELDIEEMKRSRQEDLEKEELRMLEMAATTN